MEPTFDRLDDQFTEDEAEFIRRAHAKHVENNSTNTACPLCES